MEQTRENTTAKTQEHGGDNSSGTRISWMEDIREPARALGIPHAAAVNILDVWPMSARVAWDAALPTGLHPGDAAAQASGGLYWMDGQPPPVALIASSQHGVSIEQATALGRAHDEFHLGADLSSALLTIAGWAVSAAASAHEGRGADAAIDLVNNFVGEYDPQIIHANISDRSAKLVTRLLCDITAGIDDVFGKDAEPCPEIRDAMRSFASGADHHLGRPFAPPVNTTGGADANSPKRPSADQQIDDLGF